MGIFTLECPKCGSVNTASTSLFAKKVIKCGTCHTEIDVKANRMTSKICPHCNKTFVYDRTKAARSNCPSCGEAIDAARIATGKYKYVTLNCPQCACAIEVDETKDTYTCPICDHELNVKNEIHKQRLVNDTGISVIQYEGDNTTFVWKHPIEDFNMGSQLIVHESQEAIFFLNGQALDLFGPGRYTLDTENLPVLKKVYNLPVGSQTPFHAEVYFINKVTQMGMKWGTDSRVRFVDPKTGIPLDIGASGELNIRVENSRKLLVKLVGTTGGLTNKDILSAVSDTSGEVARTLQGYFRAPLVTTIKSYLSTVIRERAINIFELDAHLGDISRDLRDRISPQFEEYGLSIPEFYVMRIGLPEDNEDLKRIKELISKAYLGVREQEIEASIAEAARQRKIIEAQTEAQMEAIRAQGVAEAQRVTGLAEAEVMRAKGYSQKDVLEAEVQKAYAEGMGNLGNAGSSGGSGSGSMATDFVGMMAGMKMAETMMGKMEGIMGGSTAVAAAPAPKQEASAAATWTCSCGESGNVGKFCMNCGSAKPETWTCSCGHAGNRGKFCEECGSPRVAPTWDCACGQTGNTGKCCPECGAKRP